MLLRIYTHASNKCPNLGNFCAAWETPNSRWDSIHAPTKGATLLLFDEYDAANGLNHLSVWRCFLIIRQIGKGGRISWSLNHLSVWRCFLMFVCLLGFAFKAESQSPFGLKVLFNGDKNGKKQMWTLCLNHLSVWRCFLITTSKRTKKPRLNSVSITFRFEGAF